MIDPKPQRQKITQGYTLDDNPIVAFNQAVYNGQQRLALEYAVLLFDHLFYGDKEPADVEPVQPQLDELKAELKKIKAALAPSRKITKANPSPPVLPEE